ncbi:MAG: hypothetical protein H6838_12980 [Planctomycetes bacterium]|nr:hypothetical protein [Planctomycetota bacterium]MCB9886402.1 hypothetical protein [Planctomycetota bacterium]
MIRSCRGAAVGLLTTLSPLCAQQPAEADLLDLTQHPERTVRAGQPFRAELFGAPLERPGRDRRDVWAWDIGFATTPGIADGAGQPLATIYVWQHPDDRHLLRALVSGVDNDVLYARSFGDDSGAEWVATFESFTWPGELGEAIDGEVDDREKLYYGYVRPGLGVGWRRRVGAEQDNLLAADLVGEVGALYFGRGDSTAATFETPDSTLELRLHGKLRLDMLTRNLIEMPHDGYAAGADVIYGHRANWSDWGDPSIERHDAQRTRDYALLTAYAMGITAAPWSSDEGQRLVGAVHAGIGDGVDRFSARRIGGGPDTRGGEYELTSRPVMPGAALGEFFPEDYALFYAGYRLQASFFAFLDAGVTTGYLDRDRLVTGGRERSGDWLTAVSARLSTGFYGNTRVQLLGAYNFDVVRDGEAGGFEFVLQVSGYF